LTLLFCSCSDWCFSESKLFHSEGGNLSHGDSIQNPQLEDCCLLTMGFDKSMFKL